MKTTAETTEMKMSRIAEILNKKNYEFFMVDDENEYSHYCEEWTEEKVKFIKITEKGKDTFNFNNLSEYMEEEGFEINVNKLCYDVSQKFNVIEIIKGCEQTELSYIIIQKEIN